MRKGWKTLSDAVAAGNALKAGEEVTQERRSQQQRRSPMRSPALKTDRHDKTGAAAGECPISVSSRADFPDGQCKEANISS